MKNFKSYIYYIKIIKDMEMIILKELNLGF